MTLFNSRVSTYQMNYFMRENVNSATVKLNQASKELGTGRHANLYEELGPRTASALQMRVTETNTKSFVTANNVLASKLESTLTATNSIRDSIASVLEITLLNVTRPITGAEAIQAEARSAIESIVGSLNQSFNGDHLFAGIKSRHAPMTRWEDVNPDTGFSPEAVLNSIVGAGPPDAATAATMITDIQAVFDSIHATDPNMNYEATFFGGTALLDGGGNPNARVTARLDADQELDYGVQANDQPFRDALRGLAMLASVDVSQISDEATYQAWMQEAVDALAMASEGVLKVATDVGFQQEVVEVATGRLEDISVIQRLQIARLENVDTYEVAAQISSLEAQLQASYSVTARLGQLSILNYL
jgi:flagellar hook-associated protein 3 FlgL